jgi:hypothetical protein
MVGYNPRCKLCNCEKRAEAEKLHEEGASLQQIVDFLAKHDITLSKAGVKRHFDTHFAPKEEAARRYYEQSEAVMQQAVQRRLTDLEMLDATIQANFELHQGAKSWLMERVKQGGVYMEAKPMVDLLTGAASEVRQAIKLKAELLGDLQPEGTMDLAAILAAAWEVKEDGEAVDR